MSRQASRQAGRQAGRSNSRQRIIAVRGDSRLGDYENRQRGRKTDGQAGRQVR